MNSKLTRRKVVHLNGLNNKRRKLKKHGGTIISLRSGMKYAKPNDDVNSCPSNLIRNNALIAHNGYCYEFVINHNFDWNHAHGDCTSKGGHLVVVRSSADKLISNEFTKVTEFPWRYCIQYKLSWKDSYDILPRTTNYSPLEQEHYAQKTTTTPLPDRERPATTEEGVYLTPEAQLL
ncbi:unnamed protein product [Mytilus edulis]|uniref:C-type lectin domain-containing protein n=1 Tax=Mytilus edulis TaxID=6550 RepID=A0A8S3TJJ2_MYTED|nr:unnamed protein product [Mytilus edulis]